MNTNSVSFHRCSLTFLSSAVLIALNSLSTNVYAQDEAVEEVERIEVTGSRIKRTDLETPVPVTVIGRDDILETGALNVADVLNQTPVAIAGTDQSNSAFTTGSVGLNTTALRNLGESRTLVLVNGRRFVSGVSPSVGYAVDLNAIPASMIERIEILKSASSAVYGSDAVAGVVNIITRKDFEGVELNAQTGISAESDREKYTVNMTAGNSWDTGSVTMAIGYDDDKGLKSSDREFSEFDQAIVLDDDGNEVIGNIFSSFPPAGRVGGYNTDGTPFNGASDDSGDRFNRASYRQLVTPIERKYAALNIKQEVSDSLEMFTEVNWNTSKTNDSTIEPVPFDAITDVYLPDRGGEVGLLVGNPMVPQGLRDALIADGLTLNDPLPGLVRRMVEFGPRSTDVERDTIRIASGFDWDISDSWVVNAFISWGKTDQRQESGGQVNIERTALAFDVVDDGMGGLKCRNDLAVLQGCVPLDLFGAGTVTPEAVDYIKVPAKVFGQAEQFVTGASIAGELPFELPGGYMGLAAGIEHRLEKGVFQPGDLAQTGASSTNKSEPTDGSFYTNDVYAEVSLPILDALIVDAAARYADHEIVGGQTTWNLGLEFSPFDDLMLRTSFATAVRTPNIADLYGGRGETFANVSDPCNNLQADGSDGLDANVRANCLSIPEIAARVAAQGEFALTQIEAQSTGGTIGGSTTVQEETADTFSAGFVWQIIDDLSMTVDYYDISIEDAIATTSRTTVLTRCFDVDPSTFDPTCTDPSGQIGAIRDANGALVEVNSGTSNENNFDTQGIDFELSYRLETGVGDFTADLVWNHLIEYIQTSIEDGSEIDFTGQVFTPENRANLNLGYELDSWAFAWRMRYWDSSVDSVDGSNFNFTDFAALEGANVFPSVVYHDIFATWYITDATNVTVNVRNLFDKQPPFAGQGFASGGTGINTVSEAYDVTGQYFQFSLTMQF
ncbi:TonB-dependent receptor plug domain-containing protein [Thalassotalea mangrovi]|uniref:TonB-dependent receptor n=1 Tax=Thalassotalea mangrovi TaxID=2572245 RepID=A0A4U1B4J3_9GAMM|nr:TonB-dependent receptor [Thalassotalea mangrovi]TKB44674.1 TonB-dependent receptor [Thalassotalea mangrovi]